MPYTSKVPKPILILNQNTILERLLKQIKLLNFHIPVFINISYLADEFMKQISKMSLDIRPQIIYEPSPLGTGITTKNFLELNFHSSLFIHGDLVFETSHLLKMLSKLNLSHTNTLITHPRKFSESRSIIKYKNNRVESIIEIENKSMLNNQILHNQEYVDVFSGIIKLIRIKSDTLNLEVGDSLSPKLINQVASDNELRKLEFKGTRISVDSFESYEKAITLDKFDRV